MTDEMFFSPDSKSMRRGKRRSPRTETCRPCYVWPKDTPTNKMRGVAMDISPYGLRVRMVEILPIHARFLVQLMRDDDFREPLSLPVECIVVRYETGAGGFTDHGFQFAREALKRYELRPLKTDRRRLRGPSRPPRMHTIDYTVGNKKKGR